MKHLFIFIVITAGLFTHQAVALIPLDLRATIQLPSSGPWDVQHVADDSTFGWACIVGDTIQWVERLGDPVQIDSVRLSARPADQEYLHERHEQIRFYRSPLFSEQVLCMTQSHLGGVWPGSPGSDWLVLRFQSLTSGQFIDTVFTEGSYFDSQGPYSRSRDATLTTICPWPPPPLTSSVMVLGFSQRNQSYYSRNWRVITTDAFFGLTYEVLLNSPSYVLRYVVTGLYPTPFMDPANEIFTQTGYSDSLTSDNEEGDTNISHRWLATFLAGDLPFLYPDYTLCRDTLPCPPAYDVAQQDADGTRRIISAGQYAFDAVSHSLLWQNSSLRGDTILTARLEGSADERILAFHRISHTFDVYNAADGSLFDHTTNVLGDIAYVIKLPDRSAEIVTKDNANTVRVYGTLPPSPNHLVCRYDREFDLIHLEWEPVSSATAYTVYGSDAPDGNYVEIGTVPAGLNYLDFPPDLRRRFFYVTASF